MKRLVLSILTALMIAVAPSLVLAESAYAAPATCGSSSQTDAKGQILNGIGQTTNDCSDSGVRSLLKVVVNVLSMIVGVVVVISLISGAFKYITSGGEAAKVANAKNTILYAIVGLVIVVLAQFIVRVVVAETANAVNNGP